MSSNAIAGSFNVSKRKGMEPGTNYGGPTVRMGSPCPTMLHNYAKAYSLPPDFSVSYSVLDIVTFMIWYDIFVNCNWVVTRWQYTFTHKQYIEQYKTNNTYNNTTILEECVEWVSGRSTSRSKLRAADKYLLWSCG